MLAGTPAGEKPKYLLSIAGLYSTAQDYLRFAQMLANGGTLDGARILAPPSVTLMTSDQLPASVKAVDLFSDGSWSSSIPRFATVISSSPSVFS